MHFNEYRTTLIALHLGEKGRGGLNVIKLWGIGLVVNDKRIILLMTRRLF